MKGILMKATGIGMLALVLAIVTGCDLEVSAKPPSADAVAAQRTQNAMQEAMRQVGMPAIVNFKELRDAKMIFELRDQADLVCYAYFQTLDGHLVFFGKCLGYGLPYSVQYTNPERILTYDGGEYGAINPITLPQPDPNGLFMPEGLSATWLMMLDKDSKPQPVYVEPTIVVMPFPIETINPSLVVK
jgi:hypothetical protein